MSNHLQPRLALGAIAVATLLSLGACANDGSDGGSADSAQPASADGMRGAAEREAPGNAVADSVSNLESTTRQPGAKTANQAKAPTVAVISTGTVSLESDDVGNARFEVQKAVSELHGTISEEETSTGDDGKPATSRLVLRIPSDSFAKAMQLLEKVGELQSSSSASEDVTTKVIDNEARVRAQEKGLERVEALIAQATNLREVIALESQLTRRQADLDALKSTQSWLKDQTTLSTITVYLERTPEEDPEEEDEESGFVSGFERGWGGLVAASVGLVTLLGLVLPFAVVLALLGVPLWLLLRGVRRRRPVSSSEPAPSGTA